MSKSAACSPARRAGDQPPRSKQMVGRRSWSTIPRHPAATRRSSPTREAPVASTTPAVHRHWHQPPRCRPRRASTSACGQGAPWQPSRCRGRRARGRPRTAHPWPRRAPRRGGRGQPAGGLPSPPRRGRHAPAPRHRPRRPRPPGRRSRPGGHPRLSQWISGSEYIASSFTAALTAKGLRPERIPPRSPNHNAVGERFHGTALQECGRPARHRRRVTSIRQLQAEIDAWLIHYNTYATTTATTCAAAPPTNSSQSTATAKAA